MGRKKMTVEQLRTELEKVIADAERKENCTAEDFKYAYKAYNKLRFKAKRCDLTPEEISKMEELENRYRLENSFETRRRKIRSLERQAAKAAASITATATVTTASAVVSAISNVANSSANSNDSTNSSGELCLFLIVIFTRNNHFISHIVAFSHHLLESFSLIRVQCYFYPKDSARVSSGGLSCRGSLRC